MTRQQRRALARRQRKAAAAAAAFARVYDCPCGALIEPMESIADNVHHLAVRHDSWCPDLLRRRAAVN